MKKSTKQAEPEPKFFATPAAFRSWLEKNHDKVTELWVGFRKKGTGKPSITWPESVDQALCFGWIDGIRKSVDADNYKIRFTPRKPLSLWSAVNRKRMQELIKQGLVHPAGAAAWERRDDSKSNRYSFEQKHVEFDESQIKELRANKKAWEFFQAQPPYYRKLATWYVLSAKQEETRKRRLARLIKDSAAGQRLGLMERSDQAKKK
jgi:uncharacterized protein YdeI (YjbR/CyaY-like superfamily)